MGDLRIGMIGTGMMGCEHIKNVMGIPEARITAIADPNDILCYAIGGLSVGELADRAGVHPVEIIVDRLIESQGRELFNVWFFNRDGESLGENGLYLHGMIHASGPLPL